MAKYESQANVIKAIQKANDAELRALADISRQLGRMSGGGNGTGVMRVTRSANAGSNQPKHNGVGRAIEQAMSAASGLPQSSTKKARNGAGIGSTPAQVSVSTVRKTRQSINKAINGTMESAASAIVESIESDIRAQIGTKSARRPQRRNSNAGAASNAAAAGHYYDKGGRLRDSSGKYASKGANEAANRKRGGGGDGDQKETNALLRRMVSGIAHGAANGIGEDSGNVAAGAAGMGVMWQASKEMMNVVKNTGENTISMAKFLNEGRKTLANKKPILRGFSANDARSSAKENGQIAAEQARKEQRKETDETHANQETEIALLKELVRHNKKDGEGDGGGIMSSLGNMLGTGMGMGALKKLRDRFKGKKGKGAGGVDEPDIDIDNGKGRGKAGKGAGKAAGELEKDAAKVATKQGEKGAEKLAKGSLVKGGEALLEKGGMKAAARVGMRAIPILGTLGMAAYDAYSAYNDDDQLKETFGDKQIGTKERVSAAAANVLDLGGLVSGTSNLVADALDGLGFTNAAQVMQMNGSSALAREFDSWFGDADKSDDDRNKSLLDKLGEVVTGIDKLTPSQQFVQSNANNLMNDLGAATAKPMQMATTSVYNAKGEINQVRAAKGWSVNPQAMITVGGKGSSARGTAMNNPGNLDFRNQAGAMAESKQANGHRFAAFATPEEGVRATGNQLMMYKGRGITKLSDIIHKWAPEGENDTASYINRVAATLGGGTNADSNLDVSDPVVAQKLISAIATHENGQFNMKPEDVQKALGTVQSNGKFAGGWTDATTAELNKTAEGRAVLANNTGHMGKTAVVTGATPAYGATKAAAPSYGEVPAAATVPGAVAAGKAATPTATGSPVAAATGFIGKLTAGINNGMSAAIPGLTYDASKAGLGMGNVKRGQIRQALNGDALVNASAKNALPVPAQLATGSSGGITGALSEAFTNATQGFNGQNIMGGLTKGMNPQLAQALSPLTNAAGNGMNSVLNLGREAVGGWINGSPASQRSVNDMAASGARLSPDGSTIKAQEGQLSTLEEIAGYLSEMLGIQKKGPKGSADKTKSGPQPAPSGDIPISSQSSVMNQVLKKGSR